MVDEGPLVSLTLEKAYGAVCTMEAVVVEVPGLSVALPVRASRACESLGLRPALRDSDGDSVGSAEKS